MNFATLSHRPESEDCFLYTTDELRLRFHTDDQIDHVDVLYGDPYWQLADQDGHVSFHYQKQPMQIIGRGQRQVHWGIALGAAYRRLQYLFEVHDREGNTWLFGDRGVREAEEAARLDNGNYFRVPYFHEVDRVKTPDWVKETVWYQIFPERFANGDKSNDPIGTKPWNPSDHPGRDDYYGGDLQGILDHLDDLQALGITGLYFCPIFKASSNHKYDTIDYLEIDPDFGDKALFAQLVEEAHARGMKIMLDAVFNHMGFASMQWQDVLAHGEHSRFADWFHIHSEPLTPFHDPTKGEGAPQYDTFAFEPRMPKLNTANADVQAYLIEVATYWIKQFDIDAWRLDVANEVDHHFWRAMAQAVAAVKPDVYILGEVWHSSQPWLNGDEFSGVMNYAFTQQIEDHFLTGKQTAAGMVQLLTDQLMLYRDQTNQVMLNMLDSHDTPRLLTVAGDDETLALQALTFTFLQTGAPCIYYGTEMGMTGENDPDDRKPMDWNQKDGPVWQRVAALIAFRRQYAQLLGTGSTWLEVTDAGLIHVQRTLDTATLDAWFNTTSEPIAWQGKTLLDQAFDGENIAPKGFVVQVK